MTSNRIIVTLRPTFGGGAPQVFLDKAPFEFADAQEARPFAGQPPTTTTWTSANGVMQYGRDLCQALTQHPAIEKLLQMLTPATQVTPIYFNFQKVADAEQLYWEALYDDAKGTFFALDRRWPIGRIADETATAVQPFYKFEGRLRLAAVLSALGAPAAAEWQNLRQAVDAARAAALPIDLLLLIGEETLQNEIQAEIAAGVLKDVTVKSLADTVDELETAIDEFKPHLLHFFCHGAVGLGFSRLEVATALNWARDDTESSLVLTAEQLIALPAMRQVWLVVLNCCQGGAGTSQFYSMAHTLVARGTPAAIGMLEPIAAADAHRFCAGFYPALFREISQALAQPDNGLPVPIEWSLPLRAARIRLHSGVDPKSERTWALPVLYARPELFQVVRVAPQVAPPGPAIAPGQLPPQTPNLELALEEMLDRAQEVANFLRTRPEDTPMSVREDALKILDEPPAVPQKLRPDMFGKFRE